MKRALEHELVKWKSRKEHPPILLRGARQVGKSYLVKEFERNNFKNVVVADFENRPELKTAFNTREPRQILSILELVLNQPIKEEETLLFLDEIQLCPGLVRRLCSKVTLNLKSF